MIKFFKHNFYKYYIVGEVTARKAIYQRDDREYGDRLSLTLTHWFQTDQFTIDAEHKSYFLPRQGVSLDKKAFVKEWKNRKLLKKLKDIF